MTRTPWKSAALAALVLTVAACGSSGGSKSSDSSGSGGSKSPSSSVAGGGSKSTGKVDVCAIVTPEEAAGVVGSPAVEQQPSATELSTKGVCLYKRDTTDISVDLLQVRVYGGPQFYGESIFPNHQGIKVKGADKAFLAVKQAPGGTAMTFDLQFVKDGQTVALNYTATKGADEATVVPAMLKIANTVADAI